MPERDIDEDVIRRLAELLDEIGLTEIEYGKDGWRVRVARQGNASTVAGAGLPAATVSEAPIAPAGGADRSGEAGAITSPMVGTAYLSPEPGAEPFVAIGDQVEKGQTLLLIEAMKTFNEIRAPAAGKIVEILVEDRTPVEYGDVLMIVR